MATETDVLVLAPAAATTGSSCTPAAGSPSTSTCPRAGDRAPDTSGRDARTGRSTLLFGLFRGTHVTLLLFDGPAATAAGSAAGPGLDHPAERFALRTAA